MMIYTGKMVYTQNLLLIYSSIEDYINVKLTITKDR